MIKLAVMAELLEEYTVALARFTERLLPPRRGIYGFHWLRNFHLGSSSSIFSQDSSSFIVYF
ncbi:hypothetical protein MANES_01G044200v8 [Manihot esculenta]|uniref:Uncharacterized protein n=1 Tax=Manihot esculenta TaxID=3983 RepID=A0A2C9WJ39_MANES|nr:hypothetical protein MANES_01G044200v8 [Manihot esculenta]